MSFQLPDNLRDTAIERLSKQTGTDLKIISTKVLSGGSINNSLKLETNYGNYFLKWNSRGAPDLFIREAEGLKELKRAAKNQLIVPMVLAVNKPKESPGFLILEYFEPHTGDILQDEELGRGLAQIHKAQNSRYGFDNNNYCGETPQDNRWSESWTHFYISNRLQHIIKLIEKKFKPSISELKIFDGMIERLHSILPSNPPASLIHGDLWRGNYINTKRGAALIDPAVSFADREMEFGMITLFGGFSRSFFDAYNEAYELPAGWQERNKIYQWYHILNHYLLFGGSYRQQAIELARYYAG